MKTLSNFAVALSVLASVTQPLAGQQAPETAAVPPKSTIVERVLVRVNGEIFTQSQLTQRQIAALRDMEKEKREDSKLGETVASITPEVLVAAVDELLLVQRGREMGVKYTDEQFKDSVERIKKQNNLDDVQFKAAIAQEGLTLDELRQQLEKSALVMAVQQREIGPSMSITQEEQRQYFEKHQADFMTPLTVTLREIMIPVTTSTQNGQNMFAVSDDASSKAKIEAIRTRALAGESFEALARTMSEATTKTTGGLVGPVNVEDLTPALKDAIAALEPGGMTLPLRGPRGYQLFKLEARSTPQLRPFDTVRGDIERAIRDERLEPETQKMLARLRTQAVMEWKDDNLRQLYEKRVAAQAAPK